MRSPIKSPSDFPNSTKWREYIGRVGQKTFELECAIKDITCIVPHDPLRMDAVIEKDGSLEKAQIKTAALRRATSGAKKKRNHRVQVANFHKGVAVPYTKEEVDYFVFYLLEYDKLYLIPAELIIGRCTKSGDVSVYDREFYIPNKIRGIGKPSLDITEYGIW